MKTKTTPPQHSRIRFYANLAEQRRCIHTPQGLCSRCATLIGRSPNRHSPHPYLTKLQTSTNQLKTKCKQLKTENAKLVTENAHLKAESEVQLREKSASSILPQNSALPTAGLV